MTAVFCTALALYSICMRLHKVASRDVTDGCHKHQDRNVHMGDGLQPMINQAWHASMPPTQLCSCRCQAVMHTKTFFMKVLSSKLSSQPESACCLTHHYCRTDYRAHAV